MTYTEFKNKLFEEVSRKLNEIGIHADIQEQEIHKMNQRVQDVMIIKTGESDLASSIPMMDLYGRYQKGAGFQDLVDWVADRSQQVPVQKAEVWKLMANDYGQAQRHLHLRIFSAERNQHMLREIPYQTKQEFLFACYAERHVADEKESVLVNNHMLQKWGISREQLMKDAMENSQQQNPLTVRPITEVLMGIMGSEPEAGALAECPLMVVTTENGEYGASSLFYPGAMEQIAEQVGGNYYVLPSSVHEVLVISERFGASAAELEQMVKAVNATEVRYEDFLSDHVYHYDVREHRFELAGMYEERKHMHMCSSTVGTQIQENFRQSPKSEKERSSIVDKLSEPVPRMGKNRDRQDREQER